MSRRKAAPTRKILPDPKYGNLKVAKFMNQIMKMEKNLLLRIFCMVPLKKFLIKDQKNL